MNKILLPLLFLSLAFGQLQRFGPLYLHDFILALILLVNRPKLSRPVLYFGFAGLVSLFLAAFRLPLAQVLVGSLYLWRFVAYSLLLDLKVDKKYLLFFSSAIAGFGLIQYLLIPDTRFLLSLNWDEHYYRLISTLFDPNFTGIILVLGLVLTYFSYPRSWRLYLLHLSALLLTYSRSSYLALFAAIAAIAVIKRKFSYILFIFLFLSSLFFLPRPGGEGVKLERLASVGLRLDNYRLGIKLWQRNPIFGLGFNTLRYFRDNQLSHSAPGLDASLLFVLVTSGVIGLAAYLNLLCSLWKKSLLLKVSLASLLVHSLFVNSLFYPFVMLWLFSLASLDKPKS